MCLHAIRECRLDTCRMLRRQRMRPRSRVRLHRFIRKREWEEESGKEMEEMNLKLYLENKGILEANNQLRKRALLLRLENLALLSHFQNRVSHELGSDPVF